jgi:hypothetical protein
VPAGGLTGVGMQGGTKAEHEKSVEEVAEILNLPKNRVKTRMFYARKHLALLAVHEDSNPCLLRRLELEESPALPLGRYRTDHDADADEVGSDLLDGGD